MKELFLVGLLALTPIIAQANCFETDTTQINRSNYDSLVREIVVKSDYSPCSNEELGAAEEIITIFLSVQSKEMMKGDYVSKQSGMHYVALSKSSLALIRLEIYKRK